MKTLKKLVPLLAFIFCFNLLQAQEFAAKKLDNVEWYNVALIKFEPGKMDAAKKIINEHFKPSSQEMGRQLPVLELDIIFNDWDQIVVFPMEEGLEMLEWEISPKTAEWISVFMKRVGGEEKAKEVWDEFDSYIKESKYFLARTASTP